MLISSSSGLEMAAFGRRDGAVVAGRLAGAHHRLAHLAHHRADVGEVEVDQARHHHQVGDAAHAGIEHLVRHLEGVGEGGLLVGDAEQVLVRDDDQRVDELLQLRDAQFGHLHAVRALEVEGLGHHADGQDALFAGDLRYDGGRTGAGAAAHAGGDEHHVGAGQLFGDVAHGLFRRHAADIRAGAGAETLGHGGAQLDAPLAHRALQGLRVGVGDQEVDPLQLGADHIVDGVTPGAADADHRDLRSDVERVLG
jgi:hypothetical protein